jgi:hypothetical protein
MRIDDASPPQLIDLAQWIASPKRLGAGKAPDVTVAPSGRADEVFG